MNPRYLPVDPDYYEMIEKEKAEKDTAIIHFFKDDNSIGEAKGKVEEIIISERNEDFVSLEGGEGIRIDRIITLNGKPGPAYDEYDAYALACLDCMGGMD